MAEPLSYTAMVADVLTIIGGATVLVLFSGAMAVVLIRVLGWRE